MYLQSKENVKEYSSIYKSEIELQVPTFFIKIPDKFKEDKKEERKSFRKKVQ